MFPRSPLPLLAIFTLDHVLWPYYTNSTVDVEPPFNKTSTGEVIDKNGTILHYYDEVIQVFETLQQRNMKIAAINCAEDPTIGTALIDAFGWKKYIDIIEISSVTILTHIMVICMEHDYDYKNLMVFDSSTTNLDAASTYLDICTYLVKRGMTMKTLNNTFEKFKSDKVIQYAV